MKLWTAALDLLFPPKCPFCRNILDAPQDLVCPACQSSLPWLTGQYALRPVEFTNGCLSPLAYRDSVRQAVHRYKFSGVGAYARTFGVLMAQCVRDNLSQPFDAVTWVPLSRRRLQQRGYDQAKLLARTVAAELSLPLQATLVKYRDTPVQSSLDSAAARQANTRGVYRLLPGGPPLKGKNFLLADDVVTSGATLSACAGLLLQNGAQTVFCVTFAQARPGPDVQTPNIPERNAGKFKE